MKQLIVSLLILTVILAPTVSIVFADANSDAKTTITKAIDKAVAGQWKGICDDAITTGFNQTLKIVYDKNVNRCNGIIVPPPPPPPTPTSANTTKIIFTGDVSGTTVRDAIKKANPDYVIVAGDLGYKSTLSWFKTEYGGIFGAKLKCLIGNHDAAEDGSDTIYKEAIAYCGDHWNIVAANNTTMMIGLNTNDGDTTQINYVNTLPVQNYANIIVVSHKNGHVFPNAHHPSEAADIYSAIEGLGIKNLYEVGGHNHDLASADAKNWFISGAGGKSLYSCGTDSKWTFCNNKVYGYLEFEINNSNGAIVSHFYDTNNKLLH